MNSRIGIPTIHPRNQAAADLCLWPHGHWGRQETDVSGKGSFKLTVDFLCVPRRAHSEALGTVIKEPVNGRNNCTVIVDCQ